MSNSYGAVWMTGWRPNPSGAVPHAFLRAAGAQASATKALLASASALAMALVLRLVPGAAATAAAGYALGGENGWLLTPGLLGVLFTSLAMTRYSFGSRRHAAASCRSASGRCSPSRPQA